MEDNFCDILGPVVQSVVSITKPLVEDLFSHTVLIKSIHFIGVLFVAEKLSSRAFAKALHIFGQKKGSDFVFIMFENLMLLLSNDSISFEQLGPICFPGWLNLCKRSLSLKERTCF